jgi:putative membrane protein
VLEHLPYCGAPPAPAELLGRFNLDPILIVALLALGALHYATTARQGTGRYALLGWLVAAAAFLSPLCALSVSLFAARVGQHMLLLLVAAPLIALALPRPAVRHEARGLWVSAAVFFVALWFWHMPVPYDATFSSTPLYWAMHVTLFGSGILLWRALLRHSRERTGDVLAAGALSSMQMGLLGAVLTLAGHPMFVRHFATAGAWGLTPLQDQQIGGLLMWVPGILFFLWAALRSLSRLWTLLDEARPA